MDADESRQMPARSFGAEAEAYERGRPMRALNPVDAVFCAEAYHHGGSAKQNRFETGEWRAAFADGPFGPFERSEFEHEQVLSRAGLVDYYVSIGWVASLPIHWARLP